MTKISQAKKIRREICRATGHGEWKPSNRPDSYGETCSRCKKRNIIARIVTFKISQRPSVKWGELNVRRFNPLDRAKERINKPEEL